MLKNIWNWKHSDDLTVYQNIKACANVGLLADRSWNTSFLDEVVLFCYNCGFQASFPPGISIWSLILLKTDYTLRYTEHYNNTGGQNGIAILIKSFCRSTLAALVRAFRSARTVVPDVRSTRRAGTDTFLLLIKFESSPGMTVNIGGYCCKPLYF